MIFLNLLPPDQKKEIQFEKTNITLVGTFAVFFIVLIICGSLFFYIRMTLQDELGGLESNKTTYQAYFESDENKELNDRIKKLNTFSNNINLIEKHQTNYTPVIVELAQLAPDDLKLRSIIITRDKASLNISGYAVSRNQLLDFTKSLENSAYISSVSSPLSNLTSPENVEFTIRATLSDEVIGLEESNDETS